MIGKYPSKINHIYVISFYMLRTTTSTYNNTGYRNITIQKISNVSQPYYLAVLATAQINGKQKRKFFGINKFGLEESMRLAVKHLYLWHNRDAPKEILASLDLHKAKKWVSAHTLEKKPINTNTGFEAVRLIKNDTRVYVVSTWRIPGKKHQKTRYFNLKKYDYPEALQMAVRARCEGLGQPVIHVGSDDLRKGMEWIENIG